jgi:hypothetical protein
MCEVFKFAVLTIIVFSIHRKTEANAKLYPSTSEFSRMLLAGMDGIMRKAYNLHLIYDDQRRGATTRVTLSFESCNHHTQVLQKNETILEPVIGVTQNAEQM